MVSMLLVAGAAHAQVTPIGPFVGAYSENFDTIPYQAFPQCIAPDPFLGNATLCTPGSYGCNITSGWSFSCTINPRSGGSLFGSASGAPEYTFVQPATSFGGYFGANSGANQFDVEFYDATGGLIDVVTETLPSNCSWYWFGYDIPSPGATYIRIVDPVYGGAFIMMDDMEYSYVTDADGDGVVDDSDNCPDDANPLQQDTDGDSLGDVCDPCDDLVDPDSDFDGVCDSTDACPGYDDGLDTDDDGLADDCDICPSAADPKQADTDGDGVGDACDLCKGDDNGPDSDEDTIPDDCDNCSGDFNPTQSDLDDDSWGDMCECGPGVPEVFPGADELCNNRDDDCDGEVDEDPLDAATWYLDGDGDGQGSPNAPTSDCTRPDGYADNADDCDDGAAEAFVGGEEVCDGLDNDCDGVVDPEDLDCPADEVPEQQAPADPGGCSCSTSSGASLGWLLLGGLVLARRRST